MAYYGVNKVKEIGRSLGGMPEKKPFVPETDALIVILDNGLWTVAPSVNRDADYRDHYAAYYAGQWVNATLYVVPKARLGECPDEGRVPSTRHKR